MPNVRPALPIKFNGLSEFVPLAIAVAPAQSVRGQPPEPKIRVGADGRGRVRIRGARA